MIIQMSVNANSKKNVNSTMASYANSGISYLKGVNKIVIVLVGLFLLLVVGMIVYWIYKAVSKANTGDDENPILVSGSIDASDINNQMSWTLPNSSGSNSPNMSFTISFWIYIADWNYRINEQKAILIKDKSTKGYVLGDTCSPGIWLDPIKNNLILKTNVIGRKPQECNVANIPIQKWINIAYVLDNRIVDVYVDCKLERSCVLSGVPLLNNHKLHLFPKNPPTSGVTTSKTGFLGQLSSLRYFSQALKPVDISRICSEGPNATVGQTSKGGKPDDIVLTPVEFCPNGLSSKVINETNDQIGKLKDTLDTMTSNNSQPPESTEYTINVQTVPGTKPEVTMSELEGFDGSSNFSIW